MVFFFRKNRGRGWGRGRGRGKGKKGQRGTPLSIPSLPSLPKKKDHFLPLFLTPSDPKGVSYLPQRGPRKGEGIFLRPYGVPFGVRVRG